MARKRLSGPQPDYLMLETKSAAGLSGPFPGDGPDPAPVPTSRAPIAQIASETAALAAFEEVSEELRSAREDGRMVLRLPLYEVATGYLIRDRIQAFSDELEELYQSILSRGQQTPVEVVDRGPDFTEGERYGLISGWRRWKALDLLYRTTHDKSFATILALVRRPETGSDAYIAMVEENEVRSNLSYYERARIARRAVEAGIFPSEKAALQELFSRATYAKRSKIKSFIPVVAALDYILRYPARIPERTGLALAQLIESHPDFARHAVHALTVADPATPDQEAAALDRLIRNWKPKPKRPAVPGVHLSGGPGRTILTGDGVDEDFIDRLHAWLLNES